MEGHTIAVKTLNLHGTSAENDSAAGEYANWLSRNLNDGFELFSTTRIFDNVLLTVLVKRPKTAVTDHPILAPVDIPQPPA